MAEAAEGNREAGGRASKQAEDPQHPPRSAHFCRAPSPRRPRFLSLCFGKGTRSEQALTLALAEMYVQGVSTRKVSAILEELCGTSVSSTHVSHCAARLDADFESWRSRPLATFAYVILDARYEKVRQAGRARPSTSLPIPLRLLGP